MQLPHTLHGRSPITFHTRTFETFSLSFGSDRDAIDVFESVKELTVCCRLLSLRGECCNRQANSVCQSTLCVLLFPKSTTRRCWGMVGIFSTRRVWANGCRYPDENLALYRHQQGISGRVFFSGLLHCLIGLSVQPKLPIAFGRPDPDK